MINERNLPIFATLTVFLLLYGFGMYEYKGFRDTLVFTNLLTDNAFLIVTAVGMTFVILSGGIDLSVGSMIAFIGVLMAYLITSLHIHPILAIAISLIVGTAFGAIMGMIISVFEIQPFIVTLAGMFLFRGLAYLINLNAVPINHPFITALSDIYVSVPGRGGLTFIAMAMLVLLVVGILIARRTRFGMNVYAIGGDKQSAALLGVPIKKTTVKIYALSGLYSALAGVIFAIYTSSAYPLAAVGVELDAIAAVVIGGTLLTGGVGYVFGSFLGAMIQGVIQTLITFDGSLNSWWTKLAIGGLLLFFILLQKAIVFWAKKRSPAT
ncbi:Inner membrane ABC transporter permease protein YjfF [Marinomonas spartinae]|uniref:Inner membrane ABC transporter permease protein YjfF n=1 Tax=Marinomonas spartinae TaxID=1792290 RepID=A0A1A8T8K5_9GAMM|nr:galactofuranose ABC transporter, permease protein YjfF [Marinomonas spartinae]SBS28222.1 Inner membrane ABC transporter permease protein YjfF [Marinomonas spartinae]SBS28438.1 Inner membrane ABC transporter permease protein YjfF [Marinomonas spartinae]